MARQHDGAQLAPHRMKFVEHAGETIALITEKPWTKPTLTCLLPFTTIDPALSRKESRRNWGRSSRYTFEFAPRFRTAAGSTEFKIGLRRLKLEPVAVPLWTDGVKLAAIGNAGATSLQKTVKMPARFGAEWVLLSGDGQTFEIVVVDSVTSSTVTLAAPTSLTWAAGSMMFPLLFGRFEPLPKVESITPSTIQGGLKIVEDSPYARRINPVSAPIPVVGASVPSFSTVPLWTIPPNWSGVVESVEADIIVKQIGYTRTTARQAYQQANVRVFEREFHCKSRAAIAAVENFLVDRRGPTRLFMMPTFDNDLELAVDLPIAGNENHITIKANEYSSAIRGEHPGDSFIALIEGNTISPQKVTNVAAGDLTTAVAIAQSFTAAKTRISHLPLVRFAKPEVLWNYRRDDYAICRLKFIEVDEYIGLAADLPERAYVFRFSELVDVAVNRGLFTSYEQTIDYLGADWQPAPFEIGMMSGDLKFGDKLELTTFDFAEIPGVIPFNPLKLLLAQTAEGKLWCDVDEINPLDPGDGSAVFIMGGEITAPDFSGKEWKATVDPFGGMLDREVPGYAFGKVCRVPLFHPKCKFGRPNMREEFKSVGTLSTVNGQVIELAPIGGQPDLTAKRIDYFAGGKIEFGTGLTFESRGINHSETVSGKLRLVLGRPLIKSSGAAAARVWPGCNGARETCIVDFNNLPNFRAFDFMPVKNPGANLGEVQQSTGGKKG